MQQENIDATPLRDTAEALRNEGASVMHLAVGGRLAALLRYGSDQGEQPEVVDRAAAGAHLVMALATGDDSAPVGAS
jgi:Cu+-exporting ATPase